QPLPTEIWRHIAESCDIAAGAREARHEPGPDRIAAVCHHNRDRLSLSFDRRNRKICTRHDHVQLDAHQLPREVRKPWGYALAVANLQEESFPFDVAKLPHPLPERFDILRCGCWSAPEKIPDLRNLPRLLRLNGDCNGEHRSCK